MSCRHFPLRSSFLAWVVVPLGLRAKAKELSSRLLGTASQQGFDLLDLFVFGERDREFVVRRDDPRRRVSILTKDRWKR